MEAQKYYNALISCYNTVFYYLWCVTVWSRAGWVEGLPRIRCNRMCWRSFVVLRDSLCVPLSATIWHNLFCLQQTLMFIVLHWKRRTALLPDFFLFFLEFSITNSEGSWPSSKYVSVKFFQDITLSGRPTVEELRLANDLQFGSKSKKDAGVFKQDKTIGHVLK